MVLVATEWQLALMHVCIKRVLPVAATPAEAAGVAGGGVGVGTGGAAGGLVVGVSAIEVGFAEVPVLGAFAAGF